MVYQPCISPIQGLQTGFLGTWGLFEVLQGLCKCLALISILLSYLGSYNQNVPTQVYQAF